MSTRVFYMFFFGFLLSGLAASLGGCSSPIYEDKHVDIDYYILNLRADEILVKNRSGAAGIVGFFLEPGETYRFGYHNDMAFRISDDNRRGAHLIFDYYASGDLGRFDQYIGSCEFHPKLDANYAAAETCYVH
ncbi:MAG: hypothetical protein AMJ91_06850 [candidate division Zixibacteria bacterium SM23_73_3]|nr:MAG: hypothetical protein AMJ91_06850 [candidate division Zixibacteria bacterium SM23_73_3]